MEENYVEQNVVAEELQIEQETQKATKKRISKKVWIPLVAIVLALAIAVPFVFSAVFNNYKTPLNLAADIRNAKTYTELLKSYTSQSNGLIDKEAKTILNIFMDSEDSDLDDVEEYWETVVDNFKDEYGENYKFYFVIEDKEELDKDDLKEIKEDIKDFAKDLKDDLLDEVEDYDSDDWEDLADDFGVSKAQAKKIVDALENIYKELKTAKVTAGYELSVTVMVRGSELDEPEEISEETIVVCKVNGRWVCPELVAGFMDFF